LVLGDGLAKWSGGVCGCFGVFPGVDGYAGKEANTQAD